MKMRERWIEEENALLRIPEVRRKCNGQGRYPSRSRNEFNAELPESAIRFHLTRPEDSLKFIRVTSILSCGLSSLWYVTPKF